MLNSIDTGIVTCDADGRLTLFNDAARRIHGRDAEPLLEPDDWPLAYDLFLADGSRLLRTAASCHSSAPSAARSWPTR